MAVDSKNAKVQDIDKIGICNDVGPQIQSQVQARIAAYRLKVEQHQRSAQAKQEQRRRRCDGKLAQSEEGVAKSKEILQDGSDQDKARRRERRQRKKRIERTLSRDVDNEYKIMARVEQEVEREARSLALHEKLESYQQKIQENKMHGQEVKVQETTRRRHIRRQKTLEEMDRVGKELANLKEKSGLAVQTKSTNEEEKDQKDETKASTSVNFRNVRGDKTSPRQPRQRMSAFGHLTGERERTGTTPIISERVRNIAEKKKLLRTTSQDLEQKGIKVRFEAHSRRQEEERAKVAAQRRKEEEEADEAEAAQLQHTTNKTLAERIRENARRRAEEEALEREKAQRRKQQEAQAKLEIERINMELLRANKEFQKIEAQERCELERIEAERKHRELTDAVKEAKSRESLARERHAAMARAFEEQEKAILAANAVRAKQETLVEPAVEKNVDDSETDEDEDWSEETKGKFIADTKKEVQKYKQMMAEKMRRAEEMERAAWTEGLRGQYIQGGQLQALLRETTSDHLVQDEADCVEAGGDEETIEMMEGIKKAREYIASLEARKNRIADREARQIQAIEDKLTQHKTELWKRETKGLVRYTIEEEENIQQQADAARQTVEDLRNQNRTIREMCNALEQDMRHLAIQTGTLKREKAAIVAYTALVSKADDHNKGQRENIDIVTKKLIKAIDEHKEALEVRAIYGETEHKIRLLYDQLNNDLLVKFQNECTDKGLVLELLKAGEEGTDEGKGSVSANSIISVEDDMDAGEEAIFEEILGY